MGSIVGKKDPVRTCCDRLERKILDAEQLLSELDETYFFLNNVVNGEKHQYPFFKCGGIAILVMCLKHWKENELIVRQTLLCLVPLALNPIVADQIRVAGGREVVEDTVENNKLDEIIQQDGMTILTNVQKFGCVAVFRAIKKTEETHDPVPLFQAMLDWPRATDIIEAAVTQVGATRAQHPPAPFHPLPLMCSLRHCTKIWHLAEIGAAKGHEMRDLIFDLNVGREDAVDEHGDHVTDERNG